MLNARNYEYYTLIIISSLLSAGEIVNLISVDSQKLEDACLMINMMWSCPLQVGLAIYFLYQTIGVSVFVGKSFYPVASTKRELQSI